jgi:AraC-like DNA-binding protein
MIPDILAENEYYSKKMPDNGFGVDIFLKTGIHSGKIFRRHWHEQLQLYSIVSGSAYIDCSGNCFTVSAGDIVVINSCELHYLESRSDSFAFYIIRFDIPFLFSSQPDLCQTKFMMPLAQNRITFGNLVQNDPEMTQCITRMIDEYNSRRLGYELAVKSSIYELLVILIRKHICRIMTAHEFSMKTESLRRFESIIDYIARHYSENISVGLLAEKSHVTVSHFCRTFRGLTGNTFTDYLNKLRLEKSADLLHQSMLSITEIALRCGFDSINYYSRLFRRKYHVSPTEYRNNGVPEDTESAYSLQKTKHLRIE